MERRRNGDRSPPSSFSTYRLSLITALFPWILGIENMQISVAQKVGGGGGLCKSDSTLNVKWPLQFSDRSLGPAEERRRLRARKSLSLGPSRRPSPEVLFIQSTTKRWRWGASFSEHPLDGVWPSNFICSFSFCSRELSLRKLI